MMKESDQALVDRWFDEDLSREEQRELGALLEQSPEAVDWLADRSALHAGLRKTLRRQELEGRVREVIESAVGTECRHPMAAMWAGAVAAAAVLVIGLIVWATGGGDRSDGVARVVEAKTLDGEVFVAGEGVGIGRRLELGEGSVELIFDCGAELTLFAPFVFEVESSKGGYLHLGQAVTRAETPESKGFTIRTPRADVVDLGTEFVTSVSSDGQSRIDVTSGEVVVNLAGQSELASQRLRKGDVLSLEPGDERIMVRIEPGDGTPAFRFASIESPSAEDAADASVGRATVSLAEGRLHAWKRIEFASGPVTGLHDGRAQSGMDVPNESVFFQEGTNGMFLVDFGRVEDLVKVNTFSWHESRFIRANRVRATQKFTLWGSRAGEAPSAERGSLAEAGWTRLARVNTDEFFEPGAPEERPAQQASSITSARGRLGQFRYLLFEVEPTRAVHDDELDHTFYGEIDVYTQP